MGARVLNGALLGPECLVGAGALITEGKRFEPGSLIVGAPARVIRPLTDEEKAAIRAVRRALCRQGGALCAPRLQGYIADT